MATDGSMEGMSVDGTSQTETFTNPYDVLAMEEESMDEMEDAEMESMKRASPRRPAMKRDDRSVDTTSPNHKAKKIQKGEALRAAAELAKDEHWYMENIGESGMTNTLEESRCEFESTSAVISEGFNNTRPGTHTEANAMDSDKPEDDQGETVAESSKMPEQEAQKEMLKEEESTIDKNNKDKSEIQQQDNEKQVNEKQKEQEGDEVEGCNTGVEAQSEV